MRASQLRNRIKVYKPTTGRSPTGAVFAQKWEHILTLWANFEPLSVKDVISSQVAGSSLSARCVIRYRSDINGDMRVEHQGRMYQIDGEPLADKVSDKEYLTLVLSAVKVNSK